MQMQIKYLFFLSIFISNSALAERDNSEYAYKEEGYGYIKSDTVWCDANGNVAKKIYVCWENPGNDLKERKLVEKSINEQWGKHGDIDFKGWGRCSNNVGIRIKIDDSGPHVKGLGQKLNAKKNGMVLNFSFKNWSTSCAESEEARLQCIKSIAVHEFGHALGLAHEHNRADRPGECLEAPQGTDGDIALTPYDPESVMNYCNPEYNNNGELSKLDIKSVKDVYGGDDRYGFCK